jgi:hypothetical protein
MVCWKPVWGALERYWKPPGEKREGVGRMYGTLHLAQALSNRGRRSGRRDFRDAERLVKRLESQELTLSVVPHAEQLPWRTVTRTKYQLRRNKVRLQNQLEARLEEAPVSCIAAESPQCLRQRPCAFRDFPPLVSASPSLICHANPKSSPNEVAFEILLAVDARVPLQ